MEENKRKVIGIWIPIELWEDDNLTRIERDAMTEILHFNANGGQCFVSNAYLGKILKVSSSRTSQIINHLKELGYVTISYTYKGATREVDRRIIKVNYLKITSKGDQEYELNLLRELKEKYDS